MRGIIVASWILAACATAACSRQETAWQDALRSNSIAAYQGYLQEYPSAAHATEAGALLAQLRDDEAWARAERLQTPEAWQRYLHDWPDGRHAARARHLLVEFIPPSLPEPPPAPAQVTGGFEIQLGAFSDEAAAHLGLERALREHAEILGDLSARIAAPRAGEAPLWRIRAGRLAESDARERCARLKSSGLDCVPVAGESAGDAPP